MSRAFCAEQVPGAMIPFPRGLCLADRMEVQRPWEAEASRVGAWELTLLSGGSRGPFPILGLRDPDSEKGRLVERYLGVAGSLGCVGGGFQPFPPQG